MEVLPLQIPALRSNSAENRKGGGGGSGGHDSARSGGSESADNPIESPKAHIPYVKLCGLRLPDTLSPPVDELQAAQVAYYLP